MKKLSITVAVIDSEGQAAEKFLSGVRNAALSAGRRMAALEESAEAIHSLPSVSTTSTTGAYY